MYCGHAPKATALAPHPGSPIEAPLDVVDYYAMYLTVDNRDERE